MGNQSQKYHQLVAGYFDSKPLYLDEPTQKKPNTRKLVEQPWQQTKGEIWDEVTNTLCNLDFIQAKAAAKMTYELVNDFNSALLDIPDNKVNILEEQDWQARMDKYTSNLIAYSKGEINQLEIPNSFMPKSKEDSNAEINQTKTNPNRADKLRDFKYFIGKELVILQNFSQEFPQLAYQQAWYYSNNGPVGKLAEKASKMEDHSILLCSQESRPAWIPKPQDILTLRGHHDTVFSVAITPNGKIAISGSRDRTAILWDLENGRPIQIFKDHTGWVNRVVITPDGKYAFSGSQNDTCILWDLTLRKMVKKLRIHRDEDLVKTFSGKTGILPGIFAVAITPDGKLGIAGSELHNIILWDLNTGYVLQTLVGHSGSISALCISPNGEKAISGSSDHSCIVWDLLTGQPIRTLIGHEKEIRLVWMSIDQKFAISWSHSDNTVIHWDLIRGSALKKIKLHSDPGWANAITSDGKMGIYATQNKRFNFCDLFSGKINQVLCWENSQNWTVAMTPDGSKAISGGQDETCILWNLNNYPSDDKLKEENNVFESLKFTYTPNGKIVLFTSPSNTCSVWDTQFNKEIHSLKGHSGHINYISVSPNGDQALTASSDNLCIYWDLFSGEPIFELRGHQKEVDIIVFTPDGNRAFSGSRDGNCIFWNLKSSKAIHVFKGHSSSVDKIVITSDGKNAISASYGMLIVWDLTLFNQILTFKGHQSTIVSISITPDNKFVISEDMDNNCIVWELKSGEVRYQLNSQKPHAIEKSFDLDKGNVFVNHQISKSKQFIRIDPGGYKAISVIRDKVLVVWNLQSGTVIQTFNDYNDYVQSVNISPNGKLALIAYAKGMSSFVYELNGLKKIAGYFPKNRSINSKFTSNGILTIYEHFGKRVISNMRLNILSSSFLITTIRQIWDFELKDYLPLLFDCPSCSSRFKPPDLIIETIGLIANSANLITVQSPCIALPLEVWEDPGLLSICPKCGQKLKFNPFIVYDFEAEEKKKKAAEEERKYTEILENAEHAFNEADWDKAFILFLNLIQAEKFDVSYHRFKMALCRINSLDVYKPEIIANIEVLKHLLQEAGEFERVQQINDKLIERLEAIKKAKKPWWRKIKEYSKLILPKFIRSSIAITFLVSSYLLLKNSLWFLFLSIPFFIIGLMLILITHIKKINVIYSNYIKKKLNIEYVQCPKCKKMHAVNKEESKFICQKCHCEFIINQ